MTWRSQSDDASRGSNETADSEDACDHAGERCFSSPVGVHSRIIRVDESTWAEVHSPGAPAEQSPMRRGYNSSMLVSGRTADENRWTAFTA